VTITELTDELATGSVTCVLCPALVVTSIVQVRASTVA
jgi:hypothetical protein